MANNLAMSAQDSELLGLDRRAFTSLSRREEQVLSLAAAGFLDKQIGPELGVSLNTLRTYWNRIRTKVGDGTRSALAVAYVEQLTKSGDGETDDPDWEIDLVQGIWKKLSDRPSPVNTLPGEERPLDEVLSGFHPEDEPRVRAMLRGLNDDRSKTFSYSARYLTPDGEVLAGAIVRVIRDRDGVPVRLVGRRIPVFALRPSEVSVHEPVQHDGWIYDMKTGLVLASDAINRLHGLECGVPYPRARYGVLFFPDDYVRGLRLMDEIGRGRIETGNFTLRTLASGGAEQILITVHGIRGKAGGVAKVIGYRTELRKAKLLKTPEPPAITVGFWAMNLRSKAFIVPDEEFCKIYRVDRNSPTLDQDIRSRYLPADRDAAYDFIDEAVAERRFRGSREFKLQFEDGSDQWIRLEFFVETDDQGPVRMNGTVLAIG